MRTGEGEHLRQRSPSSVVVRALPPCWRAIVADGVQPDPERLQDRVARWFEAVDARTGKLLFQTLLRCNAKSRVLASATMRWRAAFSPLRRTKLGTFLATSSLRPQFWRSSFEAGRVLWFQYGHLQSVRVRQSIDGSGEAVPWYTYPAIEFLKQFDFSEKSVFEDRIRKLHGVLVAPRGPRGQRRRRGGVVRAAGPPVTGELYVAARIGSAPLRGRHPFLYTCDHEIARRSLRPLAATRTLPAIVVPHHVRPTSFVAPCAVPRCKPLQGSGGQDSPSKAEGA